jgi:hypothetical protein
LNFDKMYDSRSHAGASPPSSEGGTNLNIHERAVVVGESGRIYATLGERREDGSQRGEQLMIKPLKSEVEKDKKLVEAKKAKVESQKQFLDSFAGGGSITYGGTSTQKFDLFQTLLQSLGGAGGGTKTPFGGARHLAGLEDEISADPYLKNVTEATYSAQGIDPEQLWAGVARYQPMDAQRTGQTNVRKSFL